MNVTEQEIDDNVRQIETKWHAAGLDFAYGWKWTNCETNLQDKSARQRVLLKYQKLWKL